MESKPRAAFVRPIVRRARPVVVVCAVVAALVLVLTRFRAPGSHTVSASSWSQLTTGGPSARVEAGGLVMTLSLQPGPYFLGELVAERITLANNSTRPYSLEGVPRANHCDQALGIDLTDGSPPTYILPTQGNFPCPFFQSTLAAGQTWTVDDFLVVTTSGHVTATATARFMTKSTAADGTVLETGGPGPFKDQWPVLHLTAAAHIPIGHTIALHNAIFEGSDAVIVDAPAGARANLYYIEVASCQQGQGGEVMPRLEWQHLSGTTLDELACDGTHEVWSYSIAAPGYAIASGKTG
jgi:hypothetical protein